MNSFLENKNLFDHLFVDGHISPDPLLLSKKSSFVELFDKNKLAFILENEELVKDSIQRPNARDDVELSKYYHRSKNCDARTGMLAVDYAQPSNNLFGRYQAKGKLSGQGMLREIRYTIFDGYYVDIDVVNCHPVLLMWLCDNMGVSTTYLKDYVDNRELHMSDLLKLNPTETRDSLKSMFLSMTNNGKKSYNSIPVKTEFIKGYKVEMSSITKSIIDYFNEIYNIVESKTPKSKKYNLPGKTMAHVLQYVENQILMLIFNYIESEIGSNVYNSILCFDGIMILKNHYKEDWLLDLESLFASAGLNIKIKAKDMSPIDLTKFGYNEDMDYCSIDRMSQLLTDNIDTYSIITDNTNNALELQLLHSSFYEGHVREYLAGLEREYIYYNNTLYKFNGVYWVSITSKTIYNILDIIYAKLEKVLYENMAQFENFQTIRKQINILKKESFRKNFYKHLQNQWVILEDIFDTDINLIGFKNGVYDLELNVFRLGRYEDYITKVLNFEYEDIKDDKSIEDVENIEDTKDIEESKANEANESNEDIEDTEANESNEDNEDNEDIDDNEDNEHIEENTIADDIEYLYKYFDKIMPIQEERDLLLLLISTALSGRVLDKFIICSGLGSNGKDSLFNYLLKDTLGPHYYRGNNSSLTQKHTSDLNVDINNMNKKRFIVFSEPNKDEYIRCSRLKDLTGSDNSNARGLYSSDTVVHLHCSIFILCNDKPLLDHVDEAIARRLITFNFRSTFKSKEFLEENDLSDGENYVFEGSESVKSREFIERYRLPMIHILLKYYQKFKSDGFMIRYIPKSIQEESRKYMEESDLFVSWFNTKYTKTSNKTDVIKLKDVYNELRDSDLYLNMTKQDKRKTTYLKMREDIQKNPLLRVFYKEIIKMNGIQYKNILTNHITLDAQDSEDL